MAKENDSSKEIKILKKVVKHLEVCMSLLIQNTITQLLVNLVDVSWWGGGVFLFLCEQENVIAIFTDYTMRLLSCLVDRKRC